MAENRKKSRFGDRGATPFVCFVHIERAGGTTLNEWLQRSISGYYEAHTWYYWSNEPECILSAREFRALARVRQG